MVKTTAVRIVLTAVPVLVAIFLPLQGITAWAMAWGSIVLLHLLFSEGGSETAFDNIILPATAATLVFVVIGLGGIPLVQIR